MMNILMRLYSFQKGEILIGGRDITKIRIKDIRKNISYISQTPYILEDTLKNNIVIGNENITDEPTSNIGLKTEDRIQKLIDKITKKVQLLLLRIENQLLKIQIKLFI